MRRPAGLRKDGDAPGSLGEMLVVLPGALGHAGFARVAKSFALRVNLAGRGLHYQAIVNTPLAECEKRVSNLPRQKSAPQFPPGLTWRTAFRPRRKARESIAGR